MKIALIGDIAPFGRYCLSHNDSLLEQFSSIIDYLQQFDVVIGNLETPFADNEQPISGKSATIKSDPSNINLLKFLGITHVTLANNHIGDFGFNAYNKTKNILENSGIDWFGTEGKQVFIEKNNEKIALLGYCSYNTNPSPVKVGGQHSLNYLNVEKVCEALRENASNGYFSVLSVHSGQEHIHLPSYDDVAFARGLAKKIDYVYYGHHPHVVQGHEKLCGSTIFYSLGNFIFDDVYTPRDLNKPLIKLSEANKTGIIGKIEIKNGYIINSGVMPIYMGPERMLIGNEVLNFDMQVFDDYLINAGTEEYDIQRMSYIHDFIQSRQKLRDFKWYLCRLNMNSCKIIFNARKNAKLYHKVYSSKLTNLDDI